MSGRLKTLILDADGGGWSFVAADTLLRGLLKDRIDVSSLPRAVQSNRWCRRLLGPRYRHLSYVLDWREALREAPELDVEMCNINNLLEYRRRREAIRHYPLIIVLHSAAGDSMGLLQQTAHWFEGRRGRLVVFLGNEYDLMDRKVAFLRSAGPITSAANCRSSGGMDHADCRPARILSMPHALNPRLYSPGPAVARRVDIGFCGDVYHPFVGDIERNRLLRFFEEHGCELGLELDFRLNARMERTAWPPFSANVRRLWGPNQGPITWIDAGLDPSGQSLCVAASPRIVQIDLDRFFRNPTVPYVSGKSISSRHFEPIGTKTCQLLLGGHYDGILHPTNTHPNN